MENFLNYFNESEELVEEDSNLKGYELASKMMDFIESNIDIENLDEEQSDIFNDILEDIENLEDDQEDGELEEVKRVKISPKARRQRAIAYRKNKSRLKLKAKKFRKTAKFKKYKKKAKRAAKRGKTTTGKRKTTYI